MGIRISGWLLLLTVITSCRSLHMRSEESFLSTSGKDNNIMIISHLPDHPEASAMSLLLIPPNDSTVSATAFLSFLNTKSRFSVFYYNDSVVPVEQAVFPVVFRRFAEIQNGFDFYLYRNKLLFKGFGMQDRSVAVEFNKQLPFTTDSTTNGYYGIEPITTGKNEKGKLFIHVLSNPDSLFEKGTKTSYYWIDYTIRNAGFTLYYSQTASGQKSILYSTGNPNFSEQAVNDPLVIQIVHPTGQTIEFRPILTENFQPQKSGFVSTSAAVFEGGEQVGTGIIYYLSQP